MATLNRFNNTFYSFPMLAAIAFGAFSQICTGQVAAPSAPSTGLNLQSGSAPAVLPASKLSISGTLSSVPEDFASLRFAPGFLLSINVYDSPELSGEYRIDEGGAVSLPLVGKVQIGGQTLSDAQHGIEKALLIGEILNHPQVTINVEQYAPFVIAVIGEVQQPGRVQLLAPHSLLDILSQVGGETPLAGSEIQVRHNANGSEQTYTYKRGSDGTSIKSAMIDAGDTVIVPRAGIVYVLGAVNRPGGFVMQEDGSLNVTQALSLALGTALQAKVGDIRVIRRKPDGTLLTFPVDYGRVTSGKAASMVLAPEDIVYVPVSKIKAVFTSGSTLVGQTASAAIYAVR